LTNFTYELLGNSLIAGESVPGNEQTLTAWNPATNEAIMPTYSLVSVEQVSLATGAAEEAFDSFRALEPQAHADFLEQIATNIDDVGEVIVERAIQETGLSQGRLQGELKRTTNQFRLFASVVRDGNHLGVRIDPAIPEREPAPRVDIRQRKIPLGPVAVFGASNFPLAFSTGGGDTASALAAGCPVVFKAHNAHPGTSELVGQAISLAVKHTNLHPGVFSLLYGPGNAVGQSLVADPAITAVGFTGSRSGGQALIKTAAERTIPIPVYAEMSSINPVYIFPGALQKNTRDLAEGYVQSVTGSSGQLCTQPGIVFVPNSQTGTNFAETTAELISNEAGQTMLTQGIYESWVSKAKVLSDQHGVQAVGAGRDGDGKNAPAPAVFEASIQSFIDNPVLHEEIFGAASLILRYDSVEELLQASRSLEGQLTATLQLSETDYETSATLLPILEQKAGRLLVNGWPTGVEVGHAMVHGGPYPASSDSRTTSVGTLAIDRFLRPVAYQNMPPQLLPQPVQSGNPWSLARLVDGKIKKAGEQ